MTTINLPSEIAFSVRGLDFTFDTSKLTSARAAKGLAHAFKQYCGDRAAGKSGAESESAVKTAFANLTAWLDEEIATRASLPKADTLFITMARGFLRGKGVASKITVAITSRDAAIDQMALVFGSDESGLEARIAKIDAAVAVNMEAMSDAETTEV